MTVRVKEPISAQELQELEQQESGSQEGED